MYKSSRSISNDFILHKHKRDLSNKEYFSPCDQIQDVFKTHDEVPFIKQNSKRRHLKDTQFPDWNEYKYQNKDRAKQKYKAAKSKSGSQIEDVHDMRMKAMFHTTFGSLQRVPDWSTNKQVTQIDILFYILIISSSSSALCAFSSSNILN